RPISETRSTVLKPTSGRASAAEIAPTRSASLSIAENDLSLACCIGGIGSNLLDVRLSEQTRRPEDQYEHQDRESGDILVLRAEIGRVEDFDKADEQPAQHGAGQRSDAAQHGRRERLDAGKEADIEVDDAVIHQPGEAGDGRQ